MPGPFPGTDPWLEHPEVFPSLHHNFITYLQEFLNANLSPGYVAGSATRVWVDDTQSEPDVSVLTRLNPRGGVFDPSPYRRSGMVAVASRAAEPREEAYLEIRTGRGRRLVTHIEVVSPSNKSATQARELYQARQFDCEPGGVNLVEIDLLRRGSPVTTAPARGRRAVRLPRVRDRR